MAMRSQGALHVVSVLCWVVRRDVPATDQTAGTDRHRVTRHPSSLLLAHAGLQVVQVYTTFIPTSTAIPCVNHLKLDNVLLSKGGFFVRVCGCLARA